MNDILLLSIYLDKSRNMIFVPCKKTEAGFRLASEPYRSYGAEEIKNIDAHIKNMMDEIAQNPIAENSLQTSNVMKKICGKKSYKQFTREHINIDVSYDVQENRYRISNEPRLSDGSYGVRRNSISERYSSKYECSGDENDQIREIFLKAYAEAQNYLYEIGELNEPAVDFVFGHKTKWIAVRDVSSEFIIGNDKFANAEKTSWMTGLYTAENDNKKVFIFDLYNGWTIVVGKILVDITEPQAVIDLLRELSGGIKEICYFSAHDAVGVYGFARMLEGNIDRMYGYSGETGHVCINMGERSQAEQELSLNFANNNELLSTEEYDDISEEAVLKIASKWGIELENLVETKTKNFYIADFSSTGKM